MTEREKRGKVSRFKDVERKRKKVIRRMRIISVEKKNEDQ